MHVDLPVVFLDDRLCDGKARPEWRPKISPSGRTEWKRSKIASRASGGTPGPSSSTRIRRILAYGAHHDAITGVESDQVYLDLLGWREAWELASAARRDAAAHLAGPARDSGLAVTVVNGLARPRDGMARVTIAVDRGGIQ